MDELIIDDKKYVSSKRAAELTGYAKDYVGQLAREGYVEARRVGRSWYVLESAIQDHRFGSEDRSRPEEAPQKPALTVAKPEAPREPRMTPVTWESPKYVAETQEELPSINLLRREAPKMEERIEEPGPLENAWQTWFETYRTPHKINDAETAIDPGAPSNNEVAQNIDLSARAEIESRDATEVVPVHALPDPRPIAPTATRAPRIPLRHAPNVSVQLPPSRKSQRHGRPLRLILSVASYVVILISAATFLLGTGYFDEEIISNERASYLAGISVYEKVKN